MYYGIAVSDLGIAPSEVRNMTIGEIQAVIWAKTRTHVEEVTNDELLEHLNKAREDG